LVWATPQRSSKCIEKENICIVPNHLDLLMVIFGFGLDEVDHKLHIIEAFFKY
jgi:hypothetical protein